MLWPLRVGQHHQVISGHLSTGHESTTSGFYILLHTFYPFLAVSSCFFPRAMSWAHFDCVGCSLHHQVASQSGTPIQRWAGADVQGQLPFLAPELIFQDFPSVFTKTNETFCEKEPLLMVLQCNLQYLWTTASLLASWSAVPLEQKSKWRDASKTKTNSSPTATYECGKICCARWATHVSVTVSD